jgi:hypothetical protein
MLRSLALLAGLVLLAALALLFLRGDEHAPVSTPALEPLARPEDRSETAISAEAAEARNTASASHAPKPGYVGIAGTLTREENETPVNGGFVTLDYRYLGKGAECPVRGVRVEVDSHGHFEQEFSEPVMLVHYDVTPATFEVADSSGSREYERADFLRVSGEIEVSVTAAGTSMAVHVPCGLDVHGQVFDARTHAPIADALVVADVGIGHAVATLTDPGGWYSFLGIDPRLALRNPIDEKNNWFVDGPRESYTMAIRANRSGYAPGSVVVPLPLGSSRSGPFEIQLVPGIQISGTALAANGKPAQRAHLSLATWQGERPKPGANPDGIHYYALADDQGFFSFEGVLPADGGEIRLAHATLDGPEPTLALGALHEARAGLELRLRQTQLYRVRARGPDGVFLDGSMFSLSVHDPWGERRIESTEPVLALRVRVAVGERSELLVRNNAGTLHAKTTVEPVVGTEVPEELTLDLEP